MSDTIEFKFPADRTDIAAAIGRALLEVAGDVAAVVHVKNPDIVSGCPGDCADTFAGSSKEATPVVRIDAPAASSTACDDQFAPDPDADTDAELADRKWYEDLAAVVAEDAANAAESNHGTASSTACDDQLAPDPDTDTTAIGPRPGSQFADVTPASLILDPDATAAGPGVLPELDTKGVGFSLKYCGVSAKPFYESGKMSGQWKKRRGVDQGVYDDWYAGELQPGAAQTAVNDAPINTAGAFNGQTTETPTTAPTTAGAFMEWVSNKQVAGLLDAEDVKTAYTLAGFVLTALVPPNADDVVAERIAGLYATLAAKAGA